VAAEDDREITLKNEEMQDREEIQDIAERQVSE
jgi:hypothetical protein